MERKLSFLKKLKILKAEGYVKEAKHLKESDKYEKAIQYLLKAQKIFNVVLQDEVINTIVLSNLGDTYFHMHLYKKALEFFKQAEQNYYEKKINHSVLRYQLNQNMASCYKELGNFEQYIEYLHKTLDLEQEEINKATIYIELSHAYRLTENFKEALTYSQKSLELYKKHYPEKSFEIGNGNLSIALVYLDQSSFKEAVPFLEQTEKIFETISVSKKYLANVYELLEYAFFNLGYKDTAVFYSGKTKKLLQN